MKTMRKTPSIFFINIIKGSAHTISPPDSFCHDNCSKCFLAALSKLQKQCQIYAPQAITAKVKKLVADGAKVGSELC